MDDAATGATTPRSITWPEYRRSLSLYLLMNLCLDTGLARELDSIRSPRSGPDRLRVSG